MDHKNNLYRSFGCYFISIFSDELIAILVVYELFFIEEFKVAPLHLHERIN